MRQCSIDREVCNFLLWFLKVRISGERFKGPLLSRYQPEISGKEIEYTTASSVNIHAVGSSTIGEVRYSWDFSYPSYSCIHTYLFSKLSTLWTSIYYFGTFIIYVQTPNKVPMLTYQAGLEV